MSKERLTVKQKIAKRIELRHQNLVFIDKKGHKATNEHNELRIHSRILPKETNVNKKEIIHQPIIDNFAQLKKQVNSIVVYTCITNNYDELKEVLYPEDGIDYICFTDSIIESKTWEIREIPSFLNGIDDVRKQRCIKIMPHLFLENYDVSLWIDGNIQIIDKIKFFILNALNNCNLVISKHPFRDCIYEEAKEIIIVKKDSVDVVTKQIEKYKKENYPQNFGLVQTGVIIRRHNNKECVNIAKEWWNEVLRHSKRDQLSFNYVCRKYQDLKINFLNPRIIQSEYFTYWSSIETAGLHGNEKEKYLLPNNYGLIKNYFNGKVISKTIPMLLSSPLYIFYHIGAIDDDYQDIVNDQVKLLKNSGLYLAADKIFYSIVGKQKIILPKKFECVYKNEDFSVAELPIIDIILEYSKNKNFKCLYFHTKGSGRNYVKTPKSVGHVWRKYLEYFNIELWKKNLKLLDVYDTVGTSFLKGEKWYFNHYSGNFWWSKSEYIKNLNSAYNVEFNTTLTGRYRFKAEMWIVNNEKAKYYNWYDYNPGLYDEKSFIKPEEYRKF